MAYCTFGSEPKPAAAAWWFYTDDDVVTLLGAAGGWLTLWALGLPTGPQETATFCAIEPTGDLPTAADYALIFDPPAALLAGTYERFRNQVVRDKWDSLCQCSAEPGSVCDFNGPWDTSSPTAYTSGAFCYSVGFTVNVTGATLNKVRVVHQAGWAGTTTATLWKASDHSVVWSQTIGPFSAGAGTDDFTVTTPPSLANGTQYVLGIDVGAGHSWDYWLMTHISHNTMFTGNFGGVATSHALDTYPDDTSEPWWHMTPVLCTPNPPPTYVPPGTLTPPAGFVDPPAADACTTDQDICNAIARLSSKLDFLDLRVRVLSDQLIPFGYVTGASHTGLTGSGTLAVSDILGAAVVLTSVPSSWGQTNSSPRRLIPQVGELRFGDASYDGYAMPLHYDEELFLTAPPLTKAIVYSLKPGIVATVTELFRNS